MLGERLRVARARARKTLAELALDIGVSAQAVKKYEDDKCMPSSAVFVKICKTLDVSHEWLMAQDPLDFHSTETAPQGRHAKYWVREAITELRAREGK
jgi:transcriptional regulator with XRE-family HTH domain